MLIEIEAFFFSGGDLAACAVKLEARALPVVEMSEVEDRLILF